MLILSPIGNAGEGEARRDAALNRLRVHRPALVRRLQRAFVRHLLDFGPDISDAVRAVVPIPPGIDPRVVGSAVRTLATDYHVTVPTGGRKHSRRPESHARKLDVWAIRDRSEAECWLRDNPELPDGSDLPDDPAPLDYAI
ncbi:MAG: hypothetical protein FJ304_27750 [Planctomycetes bacterium]|nr:hypothetical protein [Planctomycetota bacterium]